MCVVAAAFAMSLDKFIAQNANLTDEQFGKMWFDKAPKENFGRPHS